MALSLALYVEKYIYESNIIEKPKIIFIATYELPT